VAVEGGYQKIQSTQKAPPVHDSKVRSRLKAQLTKFSSVPAYRSRSPGSYRRSLSRNFLSARRQAAGVSRTLRPSLVAFFFSRSICCLRYLSS
jgi:hypothetical protein